MAVSLTIFKDFPKDAFRDLVKSLVVPETIGVWWEGDPQRFPGPLRGKPGEYLEMDITDIRDLGFEDKKSTYDPVSDARSIVYTKHVVYTVNFTLRSFSFDTPAFNRLVSLILKFKRNTTSDQLQAFDPPLAYALHHTAIASRGEAADNREIYVASVDMEFNGLVTESDDSDDGGYIDQINGGPATGPGAPGTATGTITTS